MFVNTNFKLFALILKFYYNIDGDWMYSIENNIDNTIIIKKSKFITKLYKINNIDEVNNVLKNLKVEYKTKEKIINESGNFLFLPLVIEKGLFEYLKDHSVFMLPRLFLSLPRLFC